MIIKNSQNSLVDYLVQLMPGLQIMPSRPSVDERAAESLFELWKDSSNKLSEGVYTRPSTTPISKVNLMQNEGLIQANGHKLEITDIGKTVIKTMILGDESSIFDEKNVTYAQAHQNTRIKRASSIRKKASNDWWERFAQ